MVGLYEVQYVITVTLRLHCSVQTEKCQTVTIPILFLVRKSHCL